ncbi:MAG: hypothetical protein HZB65_00225, partial [Candidatus Aenigmarchaeota archaeon]|nr:hypothetical protein [Candidatus Aenigmarchaeota archaeon]
MNKWVFIILIIAVVIVAAALFLPRQATSIINNQEQSAETPAGSAAAPVSGIGVYRLLQNSVKPDQEFDVVLNISLGEKKYYIIDESIPDEFVVIDRGAGALSKDA